MKLDTSLVESASILIQNSQKIVITNHVNPDGDAMGSALGLQLVLNEMGKAAQVVVPNTFPSFLAWMKGADKALIFDEREEAANKALQEADLIIYLDYNSLKRSGPMLQVLTNATAKRLVIDHHQEPDDFADVLYSDTSMSSTCEMVFHLIENLRLTTLLDTAAAECLYSGIITDTGNFRFASTSIHTHEVAGKLLAIGVAPNKVAANIYDTNTPARLGLLGRLLDKMELVADLPVVILHLSATDLAEFNYKKGDTEGFVNQGLSLQGKVLSIFCSEKDGKVKMSFRSKGSFNVNEMARQHFSGGGHINAAGGISDMGLEETLSKIRSILPKYKEQLNTKVI